MVQAVKVLAIQARGPASEYGNPLIIPASKGGHRECLEQADNRDQPYGCALGLIERPCFNE